MKTIAKLAMAFSFLALAATAPSAAQAQWVLLGEKAVSLDADRDIVSAVGEGTFSGIRLCVRRRAVRFYDLDVEFGNGGHQDLQIRRVIGPGECTRAIDIRGNRRFIRRVILNYQTVNPYGTGAIFGPQAIVEVYGRR
ncbi:MAG TPA: hypothetical protein VKA94_05345 [Hyphomicrobiales bacterium]|nr:hypothetical protein [Hyphomicrobiales bacterium]